MLAARSLHDEPEPTSLLAWLVPASLVVHAVVVSLIPGAPAHPVRSLARAVLVLSEPPPLPKAPPPAPTPPPPATAARAPAAASTGEPRPARAEPRATSEAPIDFTGTTLSNVGPGVAVDVALAPPPPSTVAAAPAPRKVALATVPLVPAAQLGRPPRAPGLDAALEREFPVEARRSGISGTAVLTVELLPDGRVGRVERSSESWSGFAAACERTVRSGRWEPPLSREGRAVRTEIRYVCRFEVRS